MDDREYESLKRRMLLGEALPLDSAARLLGEAKIRDDLQVWPALECALAERNLELPAL